jgi:erythromycin esterase-like protein
MKKTRKRLLMAGLVFVGLTLAVLWLVGVRIGHVRFLILQFSSPPTLSTEETAELHAWLREDAVHLKTVAAGSGFDDMQPLKAMIGDSRVVALGEAAHLNRDFYRVKHRMVEFLVNEMDFTVFAIEATFAGALELNDYIVNGNGTPESALAALVYRAWRTEAVLDMVKWMRQYNATHEKKVRFYGFDDKPATRSAEAVSFYLRKTSGVKDYDQLLSSLMELSTAPRSWGDRSKELGQATEQIKSLIRHLETQRPAPARPTSDEGIRNQKEWSLAVRHARILLQNAELHGTASISEGSALRDKHMAENARWIVDHEEGAKTILWAANPHIGATPLSGSMGYYLRRIYGNDMMVLGLLRNRKGREAGAFPGTFEAVLTQAGLEIAVIDLRSPTNGAASRYFNAARKLDNGVSYVLPWTYDAILFIESTTSARPVKASDLGATAPTVQSSTVNDAAPEDSD